MQEGKSVLLEATVCRSLFQQQPDTRSLGALPGVCVAPGGTASRLLSSTAAVGTGCSPPSPLREVWEVQAGAPATLGFCHLVTRQGKQK